MTANGYEVSIWSDENVLKLHGWLHNHMGIFKTIELDTLNCIVCKLYLIKALIKKYKLLRST